MASEREVEVRPEPPEDERAAISAALEESAPAGMDAWSRAALVEATRRDPHD